MPNSRKSHKNPQAAYRRELFNASQYWNINYTEEYSSGVEKDFKTVISAKSYQLAIRILETRLKEDNPLIKVKSVQGFMFHKEYRSVNSGKLRVKNWEQIRKASFPNENNFLFKVEIPRPEWKTNRFNKTNLEHVKSIGFKKGESNWATRNLKGKVLPLEERAHKIWRGRWVDWDPYLRENAKNELLDALAKSKNNRTYTAELLGVARNTMYKLFRKFPEIDWEKDYAPLHSSRVPSKAKRVKRKFELKEMIPRLDSALASTGGNRTQASQSLGLSISVFNRLLRATRDQVDWFKKYPSKFANKKK